MSLANWACSVSEISPHHTRRRSSPVNEASVFATEISVTGLKCLRHEHSGPVTEMKRERSRLVHVGERAEISHMNKKQNPSR